MRAEDFHDPEALRSTILDLVGRYHELAHAPKPFTPGASPVPVSGRVYDGSDMRMLVDSALDFFAPGFFNAFFHGPFIEALNQLIDQQAAFLSGQRQCLPQHFRNLWRHFCHDHLTWLF